MSDFNKFVNRRDESSAYEKISVNPIEKDRKGKEEPYSGFRNFSRTQALSLLTSFFKKVLSLFPFLERGQRSPIERQALLNHLVAFRSMLITLSKKDESHNPEFTFKLTELWHNLVDDCNSTPSSDPEILEILIKINFFLNQVQNYPAGADHTLGYYFNEYAGKEWIPFPFMELLQLLHDRYQVDRDTSMLGQWLSLLDEILKH